MNAQLESLITEYKDFYREKIHENKNQIVTSFVTKDFEKIHPLIKKNEKLTSSGFQHAISIAYTIL